MAKTKGLNITAIAFTPDAWEDYSYWKSQPAKKLKRVDDLIKAAMRSPMEGVGKPERLTSNYQGYYSRRIDDKNRLVYTYKDNVLVIAQCRFHYQDK